MKYRFPGNVHFHPWVGEYYDDGFMPGVKLLVVGESHYGKKEQDSPFFTNAVIEEYVSGKTYHAYRTYTKFGQALTGLHNSNVEFDRSIIWNRISFYNYVQEIVATKARTPPTSDMFNKSEDAFWEILKTLAPSHILMWGNRLWKKSPGFDETHAIKIDGREVGRYVYSGGNCRVMKIRHPSAGFSYLDWHPIIKKFLGL